MIFILEYQASLVKIGTFGFSSSLNVAISFSNIDEHWPWKVEISFYGDKISFLTMVLIASCNSFKVLCYLQTETEKNWLVVLQS